ncbi:MAG: hypothetical protein M3Z24_08750, partial [Chloroflexota bacterium]|nr:hypothetical protein [Chloroflexota bacterium]
WQRFISAKSIARAQDYFQRRGGWAILLTRFLFSGLGGIMNLVAGSDLYSYRRFLFYDSIGETLGTLSALLLGYLFGSAWEEIGDTFAAISAFALIGIGILCLGLIGRKLYLRFRQPLPLSTSHEQPLPD